ncbi:MAG: DNA repair protein RecO [Kiritimatiellae bacterium]|nr:DNA repair protein RecO [Kiritimatiellia bacterium]MDD5521946.1 DNA repair protein RecO [Kiritimatiellia bacterium]
MIEKTDAIVLRISPYSKTSQVVTWITRNYGRLVTLVKGACRPKSSFLGQYDLFYTCEILFYRRERNAVHILRECSPVQTRSIFRANWKAMICASYVCDLVARVSPEHHSQPELFELVESSLDHLSTGNTKPQFLVWFELKLMELLGMAPQLLICQSCQTNLSSQKSLSVLFSPARGSILCPACSSRHKAQAITVTPDILAMLRNWQASDKAISAGNTRITKKQLIALRRILDTFLDYHLDFVPLSRSIVMDLIQETAPSQGNRAPGKTKIQKDHRRE